MLMLHLLILVLLSKNRTEKKFKISIWKRKNITHNLLERKLASLPLKMYKNLLEETYYCSKVVIKGRSTNQRRKKYIICYFFCLKIIYYLFSKQ